MVDKIKQMLDVYAKPQVWQKMMHTAMKSDFSWKDSASKYQWMYGELIG